MANTSSAKKRIRQNEKRRIRNKADRTRSRSHVRTARVALGSGDSEAASVAVRLAASELDRAAAKGVIHSKNASRRKRRLMKQLAALVKG